MHFVLELYILITRKAFQRSMLMSERSEVFILISSTPDSPFHEVSSHCESEIVSFRIPLLKGTLHLKDLARLPRLQLYIFLTNLCCSIEAHTLSSYTYRRVSPTDLFEGSWELFSVCAR